MSEASDQNEDGGRPEASVDSREGMEATSDSEEMASEEREAGEAAPDAGDASEPDDREDGSSEEVSSDEMSSEEASLAADLRSIRELLERTGRRDRFEALLEGATWYFAAFGAVALSAVSLGLVVPSATPRVMGWIAVAGGGAVLLAAVGSLWRLFRTPVRARTVGRRLQQVDRSLRNDLVAALEFGETLSAEPDASSVELGFSRTLARRHIRETLRELRSRTGASRHLAEVLPDRHFTPPLVAVAGCAVLLGGAGFWAPDRLSGVFDAPFDSVSSSEEERLVRPIVGDIRLVYAPPRYTGESQRTEPHTTGHIEAVGGSEVTVTTYPLMEVTSVEMVLETGDEQRVVPLRRNDSGQLEKTLVLTDSGTYHFRATLPDGTEVTDGMERRIEISRDESPQVTITSHERTVEVSPEDVLEIEFRAEDDYGLESIDRVHYFGGGSDDETVDSVDLPSLSDTPQQLEGAVELDLRSLELEPKDVVVVLLRATDNNSRTGPGVGESHKLKLKVASVEDKHLELVRAQRELADQLLGVLGDYLEHPVGERVPGEDDTFAQEVDAEAGPSKLADRVEILRKIFPRQQNVLDEMKELAGRMKEDPLMVERNLSLFEGLHQELRDLHERGTSVVEQLEVDDGNLPDRISPQRASRVAEFAADMEGRLEKGVLRLLEMVASQKMDAVQATRDDIKTLKDRLEDLMKRYKETNDPELEKEIKREINRLEQRMSEMMQRMQMQIRDLPKEHLNEDALKQAELESGTQKLSSNLESMEEKFDEGDVDGALEDLEKMSSKLDSFGQQMDQQFSSAQPQGMSKLDEKVSELMNRANDLKSAEKQLEEETKQLQKELQQKRQKQVDEMLDGFSKRMKQKVDRQLKSLEEMAGNELDTPRSSDLEEARESLRKLRKGLEQKDMEQSVEAARESVEKMRTMRFNMNLSERRATPGSERQQKARRAKKELDEMMPRGKEIQRKIKETMERAQRQLDQSNPKRMENLAQKQQKIAERAGKLNEEIEKASKEFPMLKQKLQPSLEGASEQMNEAEGRLSKGKPQGALDSERSALEKLGELQKSMRETMRNKRQRSSGRSGMRKDEVEIPDRQQGESRESLREDVMDAMKEDNIEQYDEEIQRYYKSLVE